MWQRDACATYTGISERGGAGEVVREAPERGGDVSDARWWSKREMVSVSLD